MKIITSIWRTLLRALSFLWKDLGTSFYQNNKHRLTLSYCKQKLSGPWTFRRFLKAGLRLGLIIFVCFFGFYLIVYAGLLGGMPSRTALKEKQNSTASEVYSADGVLLGRYYVQDRTNVKYIDIAPAAVEALVATEDARFYEHSGVDPRSLARVFIKSLLLQESSGGGSTISQQLAKNLYPRRNYWIFSTPINKMREFIIARRLEKVYTKQEIIELYFNTVPLGGQLFGIERATRRFFNTSADSLKTEEAATLIGMLKANTTYNPRLHPEKSKVRRNVVLNQMVKYGYLSAVKAAELKEKPLVVKYRYSTHNDGLAPYFREQLRLELVKWCEEQENENGDPYNLYTDGLKIYTTLHSGLQKKAEVAVKKRMSRLQSLFDAHWQGRSPWGAGPEVMQSAMRRTERYQRLKEAGKSEERIQEIFNQKTERKVFSWQGVTGKTMSPMDSLQYYEKFLNTGLLSIEPKTGYVRAWVGGISHEVFKYDHVKAKRQVGSTFKPFIYAAALENGIEPCSYFPNQRVSYPEYDNWSPRNADNKYGGEYSMAGALAYSVNTVSAQILMRTGIAPSIEVAQRMGVESELPKVPSLALGATNLSLLEMVTAYTTFANDGMYIPPTYILRIEDRKGKSIREHKPNEGSRQAISYENAATMLGLMRGVVEAGSGNRIRSEFNLAMDVAGKTGTTQAHSDGWFIGITPDLVTGVWVGAENPLVRFRTLDLGSGSNMALPIWGEYMAQVTRTPAFYSYANSRFPAMPVQVQSRMSCAAFVENGMAPQIVETSYFDRFFGLEPTIDEEPEYEQHYPEENRKQAENRGQEGGSWGNRSNGGGNDRYREKERGKDHEEDDWKEQEKRAEKEREYQKKEEEWARESRKKREEREREDNKKSWEEQKKDREESGKKRQEYEKKLEEERKKWEEKRKKGKDD